MAGQIHRRGKRRRPAEPMYRATNRVQFRLALLLLRLRVEETAAQSRVRRRRQDGGALRGITKLPIASFPAHWAPVDADVLYRQPIAGALPNGVFIAFHGSWNRAPMPQEGSNVTFQPFRGRARRKANSNLRQRVRREIADHESQRRAARADGVAQGPDGSLYIPTARRVRSGGYFIAGKNSSRPCPPSSFA